MKTTLAIFDFDGTMCPGDSIIRYVRRARAKRLMSAREFAGALLSGLMFLMKMKSSDAMKTRALSFLLRMSDGERERFDRAFVESQLLPRVSEKAIARVKEHRERGDFLIMASASTENYMRYVAEALGFDALLATPITEKGVVTDNCHGEEKVRRIKAFIGQNAMDCDLAASSAYGDSAGDLPMLRMVEHGFRVNPKKELSRLAPDLPELIWD